MPDTSVIISVYNKIREFELALTALSVQSYKNFEVIIAEDGRDDVVKSVVSFWKSKELFPLKHLTQDDRGFRKNRILNESVRNAESDYLIFFDGDCIPHSDFVKAHFENRKENTVLCGRRVNLTKSMSEKMTKERILNLDYQRTGLKEIVFSSLNKDIKDFSFNAEEAFIIRGKILRSLLTNKDEHILGCNFSLHKSLLEKINGFDENYEGPGLGEDSDIEFRLRLINAKFKSVRNLAVQYHLFHPKTIEEESNMDYFNNVKEKKEFFCKNGLIKQNR